METSKNITMYIIIYVILLIFLLSNIKEKTAIFSVLSLILILKSDIKINNMIMFIAFFMFVIQSLDLIQYNNVYEGYNGNEYLMTGSIPKYLCDGVDSKESKSCTKIDIPLIRHVAPNARDNTSVSNIIQNYDNLNYLNDQYHEKTQSSGDLINLIKEDERKTGKTGKKFHMLQINNTEKILRKNKKTIDNMKILIDYLNNSQQTTEGFREGNKKRQIKKKRRSARYEDGGVSESVYYHVNSESGVRLRRNGDYNGGLFCQYIDLKKGSMNRLRDTDDIVNKLVNKIKTPKSIDKNKINKLSNFFTYGNYNMNQNKKKIPKLIRNASFPTPETIVHRIDFKSSYKHHEIHQMVNSPLNINTTTKKTGRLNDYYALLFTGKMTFPANNRYKLKLRSNYYSYVFINDEDPCDDQTGEFDTASSELIKVGNGSIRPRRMTINVTAERGDIKYITIVYFVKKGKENLRLQWKNGWKWRDQLTKNNINIFGAPNKPGIRFDYDTNYFKYTDIPEDAKNAVMYLSKNIDYVMDKPNQMTPIVERFEEGFEEESEEEFEEIFEEGFEEESEEEFEEIFEEGFEEGFEVDDTQCSRIRLDAPDDKKCLGKKHTRSVRILKRRAIKLTGLINDLREDAEQAVFDNLIRARKIFLSRRLLNEVWRQIDIIKEYNIKGDLTTPINNNPEAMSMVVDDEKFTRNMMELKNWTDNVHVEFETLIPDVTRDKSIVDPYYTSTINGLNEIFKYALLDSQHESDEDRLANIEHPYDTSELMNFFTSYRIVLTDRDIETNLNGAPDGFYVSDVNEVKKELHNLNILFEFIGSTAEHQTPQEGFEEGLVDDTQYTEDKAINSLHECLNNNSTLEEIIYCFKEKINDDDLWFYHNNVVETDNGYEFKGDEEHMSDNMKDILPQFLLRFINIYDKLVTYVERVENAWNNYIKNGPIGLVQLFNLESNTTIGGISYDYISEQLEIIDKMTINNSYTADNNIVKQLQNKLKEDNDYIYFQELDLDTVKSRINIITEQELFNINQHYNRRSTNNNCTLPTSISRDICSLENCNEYATPFPNSESSACCFIPNENYPPAKLY